MRAMMSVCLSLGTAVASLTAPASGAAQPPAQSSGVGDLVGTWSFDGTTRCKAGRAWILSADGSYSEVLLPDRRALAKGHWRERGGNLFYSLARPEAQWPHQAPLNKRMRIVERSADRLVAIGGPRVRHVMHRCG